MPNDIDSLMSRIEEINAKDATELSAIDIDVLIAYHRKARERKVSGEKVARPQQKIDASALLDRLIPKATVNIKRRV